ncbi:YlbF family regulator [Jeotgalibaca dankookensis]|uniref:YlbF family regulator n=1 Tax=Jeotgalibaca dankookensis TaxID=708126 RepID=UPI000780FE62|nr:YlbF family regulator [Jeotgalibaca dankookensis]
MKNIYDIAYDLEKELRQQPSFEELKEAFIAVQKDPEAKALFAEFTGMQQEIQMMQMTGQPLEEDYIENAQEIAGRASENELIKGMMTAEQQLSTVIEDINKIIVRPLQEMYQENTEPTE